MSSRVASAPETSAGRAGAVGASPAGGPAESPRARVVRHRLSRASQLRSIILPRERPWQIALLIVLLVVWQVLGSRSDPFVFAPPTRVAHTAVAMISSGELPRALAGSMADLFLGLGLAVAIGLSLGFAMGASRTFGATLNPFVAAFYAVPPVALIPVLIAWTGLGLLSRVLVVMLFAVFEPVYVVRAAVEGIDSSLYEVARTFGARRRQLVSRVAIPAALPFILVGIRMASVRAVKGMVVAQVLISSYGIGGLITDSANAFRIDKVLVVACAMALLAVVLSAAVGVAERTLVRVRR